MGSRPLGLVIDGRMVAAAAGGSFTTHDPATGDVVAEVAAGEAQDVDRAVRSAGAAYEDAWRWTTPAERARRLRAVADALDRCADELAETESLDTGKPLREAKVDVAVAIRYFEYFSSVAETTLASAVPVGPAGFAWTIRQPYGVVGHVVPWNYPLAIGARTVAPALAAGNTSVLKPSDLAPVTALQLGRLALESGLPAGVLNVVPGGADTGKALVAHPMIHCVSFTGSPAAGRQVMAACASHVTPVVLELGGKCPHIVLADADLDRAVPTIVASILHNAGQTCTAGSRVVVDRRIADEVITALADRFSAVRLGRGIDDPDMGPLITASHRDRVLRYVERASADGVTVAAGGGAVTVDGWPGAFVAPTLLIGVRPDQEVARDEVFGPVLALLEVDGVHDAVAIANDSPYGLAAAVWTRDARAGMWVAGQVEVGQVFVNCYGGGVELPLAGWKQSGIGAEKGAQAIGQYTRGKTIVTLAEQPPAVN